MANKERGEMTLAAGDQTYTLFLTTNACCEMEDRAGRPFDTVIDGMNKGSMRDVRWMLWACLQEHHAAQVVTPQDAGKIIDAAGGIAGVAMQLAKFMTLNTADRPEAEEGKANPPVAEAPTGVDSISTLDVLALTETGSGVSR